MKHLDLPEILIQRINELYHDCAGRQYSNFHPEIFIQEKRRWETGAQRILNYNWPVSVMDFGTGTGFVPLTIAKYLKRRDFFICTDISKRILKVATKNIQRKNFCCKFAFRSVRCQVPLRLPVRSSSVEIVTVNSVLHHIKNTDNLLNEIDRIIKPNGFLIVGHEPNSYFFNSKLLWYNYLFMDHLLNPYKILKILHLWDVVKKAYYSLTKNSNTVKGNIKEVSDKDLTRINQTLLREKLISEPLPPDRILEIANVRSQEGFEPDLLMARFSYSLVHLETYNHLFWTTISNCDNYFVMKYAGFLKKSFPKMGSSFFAVYQKPG